MNFYLANPSPKLSPFVKQYWGIEACIPEGGKKIQRIIPSGLPELIFYSGNKPESLDLQKPIPDFSCIGGQQKEYYDISFSGKLSVFSVMFKPHAIPMLFHLPAKELFNINIALHHILKNEVSGMEDKLALAGSFSGKIEVVEHVLIHRLKKNISFYEFDRINYGINYIDFTRGQAGISLIAEKTCLSRKQLERTFSDYIGTSPKQFLKTIRFQNALDLKHKNPHLNLTSLAYAAGYYDQAHMINDFRQLSGQTPKNYFAECDPFSDYFHGSDVPVKHIP